MSRQRTALASVPESEFTRKHRELQDYLTCHLHSNQLWCWKPKEPGFDGKICIQIDALRMQEWATAWKAGSATKFTPPDTKEFWDLKNAAAPFKQWRARRKSDEVPFSTQLVNFQVFLYPQSIVKERSSKYSQTPQCTRSRFLDVEASSIRGFPPSEYNNQGLRAYLVWLAEQFQDQEYLEVYELLSEQKIGIDIFKQATKSQMEADALLKELRTELLIKNGLALRLVKKFKSWQNGF